MIVTPLLSSPCRICTLVLAVVCLPFLGCGTGDYEARLESHVAGLQSNSAFNELQPAKDVPGTNIAVRVPIKFGEPLAEGQNRNGKPVDARRLKSGVAALTAVNAVYEATIDDAEGGKIPYYVYFGAESTANNRMRGLQNTLGGEFRSHPNHNLKDWADTPGNTPDGRVSQWRKISFTGDQEFMYIDKTGNERPMTMPGVLEVCIHEEGDSIAIVAWRMPKSIEELSGVAKWGPMVLGCVDIKPK